MELLMEYLYVCPRNWFISAMCVVSLVSLAMFGLEEIRGKSKYCKFWNISGQKRMKSIRVSSRNGMLIAYTPSFIAALASFHISPGQGFRFFFLKSVLTTHFFKRIFEVLFIHKYSGWTDLDTAILSSLSYFLSTSTMIYSHYIAQGYAEPKIDLSYLGIVLFLIGISGNFYHHYLLSKLRSMNDKEYKVPKGGFFNLSICPHYLFEIIEFWGFSFISQTLYAFSLTVGTTLYLMGRSYATRRWYLSKFEDFPAHVKALLPFIF